MGEIGVFESRQNTVCQNKIVPFSVVALGRLQIWKNSLGVDAQIEILPLAGLDHQVYNKKYKNASRKSSDIHFRGRIVNPTMHDIFFIDEKIFFLYKLIF